MDLLKQSEQLNQRVGEPQAYALIRSLAAKQFTALHWPTKKLEAWRYSPVQRLQSEHIHKLILKILNHLLKSPTRQSLLIKLSALTKENLRLTVNFTPPENSHLLLMKVFKFTSNFQLFLRA